MDPIVVSLSRSHSNLLSYTSILAASLTTASPDMRRTLITTRLRSNELQFATFATSFPTFQASFLNEMKITCVSCFHLPGHIPVLGNIRTRVTGIHDENRSSPTDSMTFQSPWTSSETADASRCHVLLLGCTAIRTRRAFYTPRLAPEDSRVILTPTTVSHSHL